MEKLRSLKVNKKGQVLAMVGGVVMGVMVLIFLIFAVLYGISALNPSSFFAVGSADANATANLQNNLTSGVSQFGKYIPTVLLVLGVVLVLSAIVILIIYVRRMQGGGMSGGL
jgi:Na+-transporting methylmalonyl-CoA/oxaloacetate decarboxylase gamma subunit